MGIKTIHLYISSEHSLNSHDLYAGLKIATNMVANATDIFSLATKNSGLEATLETRVLYDLDFSILKKMKVGNLVVWEWQG